MTPRSVVGVLCAAALAAGTVSLGAQAKAPLPAPAVGTAEAMPFSIRSYGRLFEFRETPPPPARPTRPLGRIFPRPVIAPERTCDLIVVPPDADLDRALVTRPAVPRLRYGTRTGPAICR